LISKRAHILALSFLQNRRNFLGYNETRPKEIFTMFKHSIVAHMLLLCVLSIMIVFIIVLVDQMVTPAFSDLTEIFKNSPK